MKHSFESIKACRIPGSKAFDDAFGQWLRLVEQNHKIDSALGIVSKETVDNSVRDAKKFIEELIESGLLCKGPFPGTFQSADLSLEQAEEVWKFYEVHRGTPKYRVFEAPTLFQ